MNRGWLFLVILIATPSMLSAKDNPAAQQLLNSVRRQELLFQSENEAFQAEFDFTAPSVAPAHGQLIVKWESTDHWWTKVDLPGFEQVTIRNGEWEYTKRNLSYTPIGIRHLFTLLGLGANPEELTARKEKTRKQNGKEILCIEGGPENSRTEVHHVCADATTHELLSDEWQLGFDGRWKEEFSGSVDFDGQKHPRTIDLLINGKRVIFAKLTDIVAAPFDKASLAPPADAIARRKCTGMKPPLPLNAIQAEPGSVGEAGPMTATVTILADGSVGDVQLVGKNGPVQSKTVLEQIKGLRFRPAMCGDAPVVADVTVAIP
jgi:hypothetical protein